MRATGKPLFAQQSSGGVGGGGGGGMGSTARCPGVLMFDPEGKGFDFLGLFSKIAAINLHEYEQQVYQVYQD